jgi:glycosyltransferase involved in cell wall biosynthesis
VKSTEGSVDTGNQRPQLSVIVPLYNEQDNVGLLHGAIVSAVQPLGRSYEIVFVDDGSRDNTFQVASNLARNDPHLRVVKFRRNYGQTAAMAAGIEYATGQTLVTMDGDLQNDPADIGELLDKIDSGYDIAVGWRQRRQDKLITRKIPSRIANWLIGKVTGVPIHDNGCSLKAFRADLIKQIPLYSEMHRFIPAMASIAGPKVAEVRVRHHARRFGESKYGLSRIYKVLLDLMVIKTIATFASRPLRWFALLACVPLTLAAFSFGETLVDVFSGTHNGSMVLAGSGIIFLTCAVTLVCGGVLAELIYSRGDLRESEFLKLTRTVLSGRNSADSLPSHRILKDTP